MTAVTVGASAATIALLAADGLPAPGSGRRLAAVAGLVAAAGVLGCAWAVRRLTAPLESLHRAGRAVEAGRLDVRADARGTGDLGRLARSFNLLLDRLQDDETRRASEGRRLREELTAQGERVSSANAQLEALVRELRAANDRAEAGSRAKSRFLANVSHEIRTPVNGVVGMADILLGLELSPPQRRVAEALKESADALFAVMSDILDFSEIDSGRLELRPAEFDLLDAVEETVEAHAARAHAKGLEIFCVDERERLARLVGDAGRVRQVLGRLVGNAVKFTEQGEVKVRVRALAEAAGAVLVEIEVADTGPGIPRDAAGRIFEPFSQGDASAARRHGGTGLGLAIARRVAAAMDGDILLDSEPGRGSSFRFVARFATAAPAPGEPAEAVTARPRVLVVDGHSGSRAALVAQARGLAARADGVGSASEAIARLREAGRQGDPYGLALVALRASEAADLCRATAGERALGATRLVVLGRRDDERPLLAAGAGWFVKPVRSATLARWLAGDLPSPVAPAGAPARGSVAVEMPPPAVRPRVLVAEASPVHAEVARALVEDLGSEVQLAEDGVAALLALERGRFDLVLMDCFMPRLDGFAATEELRRRERAAGARPTPVIAMTAEASAEHRARCLESGMNDCLVKPLAADRVAELLRGAPGRPAGPPPAEASRPGGHVDDAVIESLRTLERNGATALVERVVAAYLDHGPSQLAAAREAVSSGEAGGLLRAVHTLKSSSANVGALRLSGMCRALEVEARGGFPPTARARLDEIEAELSLVRRALLEMTQEVPA
ncbi:MAG: ATP-binding protein [Vicinamibacteria bacterium]